MSRVTRSTLRTAAAGALLMSVLGLAACGGSNETTADATTPAQQATAPEATTPDSAAPKTKAKPTTAKVPAVIDSKINVTGEGQKKIDQASEKPIDRDEMMRTAKKLMAGLNKKGFATKIGPSNDTGPLVLQGGQSTTVMIYPSDVMAARQAAGFTAVLKNSKTEARIARKGNVLIAVSAPKGLTPELLKEFKTVRKIANI